MNCLVQLRNIRQKLLNALETNEEDSNLDILNHPTSGTASAHLQPA